VGSSCLLGGPFPLNALNPFPQYEFYSPGLLQDSSSKLFSLSFLSPAWFSLQAFLEINDNLQPVFNLPLMQYDANTVFSSVSFPQTSNPLNNAVHLTSANDNFAFRTMTEMELLTGSFSVEMVIAVPNLADVRNIYQLSSVPDGSSNSMRLTIE